MANTPPLRGANSSEQLRFTSGELRFEEIISPDVLKRAYELRYRICVEKLKWVEGHPDSKLEWDEFDEYSYHFGCFSDGILVGYMRMTKENTPAGIMSRKYFGELWEKDPRYDPEHSADVSRLVVDGTQIAMKQFPSVFAGLYRLAYGRSHLCRPPIRYIYLITTPRILTGLRWKLALPVKVLGKGITSDGKETIAASIDLEKSKRKMLLLAPWRMHKFHKVMKHATPSSVKLDN